MNRSLAILSERPLASTVFGATPASGDVRSLYIHVPFCFHKCHYCDFYSIVDTQDRQAAFVDRLRSELQAMAHLAARPLDTIFVGGGTPTLLREDLWRVLLDDLQRLFGAAQMPDNGREFTVECNPETATDSLMDTLASGGVNRISIGAQSFNARHLATLERWHDPSNVERAIERARRAGITRASVDLIFAIPGQTLEEWREDLRHALRLGTDHISCYALTYEPNTAMTARLSRGEFARADEDLEADMFAATCEMLEAHGLVRYEVSNFARAGQECRHNLAYWRQEDWLAAGPSASGHLRGHRWKNSPRLDDYLQPTPDGTARIVDHEPPDPRRELLDWLMTGLRLREGIRLEGLVTRAARVDPLAQARILGVLRGAQSRGFAEPSGGAWRLTEAGLAVADAVIADIFAAVD
ncbi:MAG: radical SAM family heme chaperone HemW [Phycisphaeraceae bacterium]|nr:radical SAM family heme chaperone HemW [Phycisphaeraceae bacterium]